MLVYMLCYISINEIAYFPLILFFVIMLKQTEITSTMSIHITLMYLMLFMFVFSSNHSIINTVTSDKRESKLHIKNCWP